MRFAKVLLACLLLGVTASRAAAQGAFEASASLGLDRADTDGTRSSRHPSLGAAVSYSYTNRALDAPSGLIGTARFEYSHATSDGGPLTLGKIGLDGFVMPALSLGWRSKWVEAGLVADYRVEAVFVDSTTEQAFSIRHSPGHMRAQFFGPYASIGLGALGHSTGKLGVDGSYQRGGGFRFGSLVVNDEELPFDLDLEGPHSFRARLSYEAAPHLFVRLEYQDVAYPTVVAEDGGIARPFDVRHHGLFLSVSMRQR
jgi:hypothetical protein